MVPSEHRIESSVCYNQTLNFSSLIWRGFCCSFFGFVQWFVIFFSLHGGMFTMMESITGPMWNGVAWRGVSRVYSARCDLFKESVKLLGCP